MGIPVLIIGKSGSGKSTSLRNFTNEIAVINVLGKPLPFKNSLKKLVTDDYNKVHKALYECQERSIVIDDAGYLITNHFMNRHSDAGAGNGVFNLYNEIGDRYWSLIEFVSRSLPEDKIVYFMMHEERDDFGGIKPKTIGKLLDEKVCLEGMFTIAMRCVSEKGKHLFLTNGDGIEKTPMGMFENDEIDNDLKFVDQKIREYWGLTQNNEREEK